MIIFYCCRPISLDICIDYVTFITDFNTVQYSFIYNIISNICVRPSVDMLYRVVINEARRRDAFSRKHPVYHNIYVPRSTRPRVDTSFAGKSSNIDRITRVLRDRTLRSFERGLWII